MKDATIIEILNKAIAIANSRCACHPNDAGCRARGDSIKRMLRDEYAIRVSFRGDKPPVVTLGEGF